MKNEFDPQKPEWFQLLDSDAPSAQVAKVNKTLPILATVVTGVVLASGAVFAGTSERGNAESQVTVAAAPTSTLPSATRASAPVEENQASPVTSTSTEVAAPSNLVGNTSIQDPAMPGVQTPRGGDHDDEWGDDHDHDDDRWDGDHDDEDDDHHERREHHRN